ncbi:hypothetical protein NEPAR06_2012 [Nematocida parisii]|uniref:Uncharacterized protein n=1 Tax=Nematocida parisii (strain ERTm3) TaxID=935791 RepID=I3EGR8_NEMP3|nr:uncharacterized protein NEPG_00191 [Nematocida parisii ERTm1]EIJ88415.1 hypothetical protein NEQG_01105 [Nematocida parisii ERTm3]KAI5131100.1 hypothetical protein NEPAR03_2279 [Nematocida parisii]KAI5167534.1 hypothetical protein NEIRO02_2042 [Nematocida sp. AWRm79]KAI5184834.1 hypothetical protein NEIRO03_1839 [Nematocida sp. AWRm78]OAG30910.1 hypothetical protein NEIG_00394 [Nematocida sp. ERTm5]|eukprot:XP_013058024.1 hypothetical protein NEPG_00191 [Nematocida parisii ERTm1]
MLIDFSKKKKLVSYKEKTPKKQRKQTKKEKTVKLSDVDKLFLKSKELFDETPSIFADIPYENTEIAVMVDPCTKTYKNPATLYEQYKDRIH